MRRLSRRPARAVEPLEARRLFAAAGDLDTSFAGDGLLALNPDVSVQAVHAEANGKTLVVGAYANDATARVWRYTVAGQTDANNGFYDDGRQVNGLEHPGASVVLADGKLVVGGNENAGYYAALTRVHPDGLGNTDLTFGTYGIVSLPGYTTIQAITEQTDGRLLLFAKNEDPNYGASLIRLNANGTFDNSFGGGDGIFDGVLTGTGYTAQPQYTWSENVHIKMFSDGDFFVSVDAGFYGGGGYPMLYAFKANGTRDTSVDGDGVIHWSTQRSWELAAIDVQADDTIYAAGHANGSFGSGGQVAVSKFKLGPTGVVFDAVFGAPPGSSAGTGTVHGGFNSSASAIDVRPDGKILVVSGDVAANPYGNGTYISRLLPSGELDSTFGSGGVVRHPAAAPAFPDSTDNVRVGVIRTDGSVTVAATVGGSPNSTYLARFLGDGLDTGPALGPTAALQQVWISPGDTQSPVRVSYADPDGVRLSSIDGQDLRIVGPDGQTLGYAWTSASIGNAQITAEYVVSAPGGSWDARDNGTYSVYLNANAVFDQLDNPARAGLVGTFAVNLPGPGEVNGTVFNDLDGDGTQEAGEAGLAGRTVYVDFNEDQLLGPDEPFATSNANGAYRMTDVRPGWWEVACSVPSGFAPSVPSSGRWFAFVSSQAPATLYFGQRQSAPVSLRAAADAHVRDGAASSTANYGQSVELHLKRSATTGANREMYLKFDLSSVASIASAKLRLNGRIDHASQQADVAVFPVGDTSWGEDTITWNNRPPRSSDTALDVERVWGNAQVYYEWDVTPYLAAEKAAGRNAVTLLVRSLTNTDPYMIFPSDEASTNRPALVVTPAVPPALPSWVAAGSAATWNPAGRTLTITGAATITADPGSDVPIITASGAAAVVTVAPASATQVWLGGITLANGARLNVSPAGATRTLVLPGNAISIDATSKVDLADNAMVLRNPTAGAVTYLRTLITRGHNGGTWAGTGLASTSAAGSGGVTALGYASNAALALATFNGVAELTANDVIVAHTAYGDTNLDGRVNTDDILNVLAAAKLDTNASATWYEGDFDYSGRADTDDILQLLAAGQLDK